MYILFSSRFTSYNKNKLLVHLTQSDRGQFYFRHVVFSSQLKSKVGNILAKADALWITLNIDGVPIDSKSHAHPSQSQTSHI